MPSEKISVTVPGTAPQVLDIEVHNADSDKDIALRLSRTFPAGTLVGVSGVKWFLHGPEQVDEVTVNDAQALQKLVEATLAKPLDEGLKAVRKGFSEHVRKNLAERARERFSHPPEQIDARPQGGPQPGEVWKPKDPRRKSGFTIKAVTETEVIAEDGRTVSLDRMKRYERVG